MKFVSNEFKIKKPQYIYILGQQLLIKVETSIHQFP
jgi:hypothetical protein